MYKKSDVEELAVKLSGLNTVASIASRLNIGERTAVNVVWRLRKSGLVQTYRGKNRVRFYRISFANKNRSGYGLYEYISRNSKIKVVPQHELYIHEQLTPELALIKAVEQQDFRLLLAALALFSKIKDWCLLNKLAKKKKLGRKIGALYALTKRFMRVRRIDGRTLNSFLKSKTDKYIIRGLRSSDWPEIQKKWRVHLPFGKEDLKDYDRF